MEVVIVGGGKVGGHLAALLLESGRQVSVVELDPAHVDDLERRLPAATVLSGSGTDAHVLELAGIRNASVLAAVTGSDETNLVVAGTGRFEFAVPRVIARVVDPRNAWLFAADMGVDAAIDQTDMLAHLVLEEISLGDMTVVLKLRRGQFELVEEVVAPSASAVGRTVADLDLPDDCAIVAVLRDGDLVSGYQRAQIRPGDEVLAVVPSGSASWLAEMLGPVRDEGDQPG
jgi:trk system potassium uptake protein